MVDGSHRPLAARGTLHWGLPFWGHKSWVGSFYRAKTPAREYLRQYAEVFNTVEGNTTFYSLPSTETVARWLDATPETFQFSFKLPRWISHELKLRNADEPSREFFSRLAPLGPRLGPFLIQLPPSFGVDRLRDLDRYLSSASRFADWLGFQPRLAVEPRHLDFFDPSPAARELDHMLMHFNVDRCWMDTRPLRSGSPSSAAVIEALRKKPDVPVRVPAARCALGPRPILRFIGHPDTEVTEPWMRRWSKVLARWIEEGRSPWLMVHLPDNTLVPQLALDFYRLISRRIELPSAAEPPAQRPEPIAPGQQLSLL